MTNSTTGQSRRCPYNDKKSYANEFDATNAGRSIDLGHGRKPGVLRAYRCELCARWHLTSKAVPNKEAPLVKLDKPRTMRPISQKIVIPPDVLAALGLVEG